MAMLGKSDPLGGTAAERHRAAMDVTGVEFIPENGGGPGVRLRKGIQL